MRKDEPRLDAEVVRKCRTGDREVFGEIVLRYQDRIFATVFRILGNREEARDLAQETFLRAWSKLDTFKEGARFSTWLYTIALNLTRSELRKRKAKSYRPTVSLDLSRRGDEGGVPEPVDPGEAPEEILGRDELHRLALAEIARLEPDSREVVVLRDRQGLSYEEIAEALSVPVGTVRSRLHRARETLRERLGALVSGRSEGGAA